MSHYRVTIKTETEQFAYTAIGYSSIDIAAEAIDLFGLCSVSVIPL